jgi:hypothetical protein
MARYVMIAQSRPLPGREDAFNRWYDEVHVPTALGVPGFAGCRRFEAGVPVTPGQEQLPYLTIYEIDADDPFAVIGEFGRRSADPATEQTDAIDSPANRVALYRLR